MALSGEEAANLDKVAIELAPPVEDPASQDGDSKPKRTLWQKVYACLTYVPPRCRYDPDKPFQFSMGLNLLFGKEAAYSHHTGTILTAVLQHSQAVLQ